MLRCSEVEPLRRALAGLDAWLTGLRREQSVTRTDVRKVEWDEGNGLVKVNPLVDWTPADVWQYIRDTTFPTARYTIVGFPASAAVP